jgi:hypothetical protein
MANVNIEAELVKIWAPVNGWRDMSYTALGDLERIMTHQSFLPDSESILWCHLVDGLMELKRIQGNRANFKPVLTALLSLPHGTVMTARENRDHTMVQVEVLSENGQDEAAMVASVEGRIAHFIYTMQVDHDAWDVFNAYRNAILDMNLLINYWHGGFQRAGCNALFIAYYGLKRIMDVYAAHWAEVVPGDVITFWYPDKVKLGAERVFSQLTEVVKKVGIGRYHGTPVIETRKYKAVDPKQLIMINGMGVD